MPMGTNDCHLNPSFTIHTWSLRVCIYKFRCYYLIALLRSPKACTSENCRCVCCDFLAAFSVLVVVLCWTYLVDCSLCYLF